MSVCRYCICDSDSNGGANGGNLILNIKRFIKNNCVTWIAVVVVVVDLCVQCTHRREKESARKNSINFAIMWCKLEFSAISL